MGEPTGTDVEDTAPPLDGLEPPEAVERPMTVRGRIQGGNTWRSVFRHPRTDTPRGRALQSFSNVFLHVYPVKVPIRVLKMRYSYRLGFIAAVLFGILTLTGVYLMFFYTPSVNTAYGDMQALRTGVGFGQLVRNVHRWAAHLMVLVVFLHMVRVFYAGAYKKPREYNWVIGVVLLLVTLGMSFTGYLLPWDQLSYWAVTVGTTLVSSVPLVGHDLQQLLLGGDQIGQATLIRFYALHVAVLPLSIGLFLAVHIWRVRKDGFATTHPASGAFAEEATERPATTPLEPGRTRVLGVVDRESVTAEDRSVDDTAFTWPHLLVRHVVVALCVCAVVLGMGVLWAAPLRGLANPNLTPEPAKAPWYFAGLQELLSHFDPLVAGILVPLCAVIGLIALPYIDRHEATEGRRRKVAIVIFTAMLAMAVGLTVIGTFFRGPGWAWVNPWTHWFVEF